MSGGNVLHPKLQLRGISWCEVEAAAAERTRWRHCCPLSCKGSEELSADEVST